MKESYRGFIGIIVIILVLAIGVGAVYVLLNKKAETPTLNTQENTNVPSTKTIGNNAPPPNPGTSVIVLPADPGAAGKATLQGIDSDGDGVRDDIQRYIASTYPNSEKTRATLTQNTKAFQDTLEGASDKNKSIANAIALGHAIECLDFVRPTDARTLGSLLRAEILNTEERSRAYIKFNDQLGGQDFPGTPINQWKSSCDFNPDAMRN